MKKQDFHTHIILIISALLFSVSASAQAKAPTIPPHAQKVYTGIYVMNVYNLDINEFSFYADFYIWFRWKGDRDPTNIEFVNAIEKWGFTKEMFHDTTQVLPDGYNYNGMRVEGRFYHSFLLDNFPLDRHPLDIRIENVIFPLDSMIYLPDTSKNLLRQDFIIPGWEIRKATLNSQHHYYNTNFGEPGRTGSRFSDFYFEILIARPASYFLMKLMLPLLIVMLASLGGLLIHPLYIDARISLPIGGLLSCVFLQQSYSDALPDVGDMVLMDKIYLLAYFLIAAIMWRIITVARTIAAQGKELAHTQHRVDRWRAFWYLLAFLVGNGILILLH
ncbi:MAG: hypothetical protein ACK4TA_10340 [Saprospiraceae bacterium]